MAAAAVLGANPAEFSTIQGSCCHSLVVHPPCSVALFLGDGTGSPYTALTCFYLAECEKPIKIVKNGGEDSCEFA